MSIACCSVPPLTVWTIISDKLSSSDLFSPHPMPKGLILIVNTALLNPARISDKLTEQWVAIFFYSALTTLSLRLEVKRGMEAL